MSRYFATFPAGFYGLIVKQLKSYKLDELKVLGNDESSITFESSLHAERLIEIRYFTNVYLIIDDLANTPANLIKNEYYSLMMLQDGTPRAMSASTTQEIKNKIESKLKLKFNAHLARNNFYLISRKSGDEFLSLRLPRAKFKRQKLQAGELRPEIAHLLLLFAGMKAKHKLLDPFAGFGSIPYEAVRGFGAKDVLAINKELLGARHILPEIIWTDGDAADLKSIESSSIDKIVTDPPWGIYNQQDPSDLKNMYRDFLIEARRVLKSTGAIVILSGNDYMGEEILQSRIFNITQDFPVLISGKKATVYRLVKI